jgi:FMN reductase
LVKIVVLVGNPKPQSRTLRIAETMTEKLLGAGIDEMTVIDLAVHSSHIFEWPSPVMAQLNQAVVDCDLLIVASPTYKATYTGLLKGFLDRYPANGLSGVIAIPMMTGGDLTHSMGVDVNLRPLLIELGASLPTKGLYFVASQMDQMDQIVTEWAVEAATVLSRLKPFAEVVLRQHPEVQTVSTLLEVNA